MMTLDKVCVRFGTREILKDLSLHVPRGRTLAVLGPNGRGKTTTLRTLLGHQRLSGGRRDVPRVVGYVPQAGGGAPPYRSLDVVMMGRADRLGLFGQPTKDDEDHARAAMRRAGVEHLAEQPCDRLSGGQRQLVLLARALATGSPAIVLDEPAAGLDLKNEMRLLTLMEDLRQARQHAIVFTTHDPNHALAVADEAILMMPEGATVVGPVAEVITEELMHRLYGVEMRFLKSGLTRHGSEGAAEHRVVVPVFSSLLGVPA